MTTLDQQFQAWERFIRRQSLRTKRQPGGALEIQSLPTPAERLASEKLEEVWAQRYVEEEFKRLGFSKIDGPYRTGPDFRVSRNRRWAFAEVETRWRNYLLHGHPANRDFDQVEYLILLSGEAPPAAAGRKLPPHIMHIDREHFLAWFQPKWEQESRKHKNEVRLEAVAGAMHEHWTTICSDADRQMSTCPHCNECPYFGEGIGGEASPFFRDLAARFIGTHAMTGSCEADLKKIKPASLRKYVSDNPPA